MPAPTEHYQTDVLIIGAGAAGLLAARILAEAGRPVLLVEAQNRLGGRVHTVQPPGFGEVLEAGAEFMHEPVPLTRALLTEAGIAWQATAGRTYVVREGQVQPDADFFDLLPPLLAKLDKLQEDLPLADFLAREFTGEAHAPLRAFATQFAEGYDAADARRVSALALRAEWAAGGAEDSPRPAGGYGPLLHWLAGRAQAAGATLHLATPVQAIRWQPGAAEVIAENGASYHARQVLCTVPLGVWQRPAGQPGHLGFVPELPAHRAAAAQLGFGAVIKIQLDFAQAIWQARLPELEFLLSDAPVPTWWSQLPAARPLLTGWLAGPAAQRLHATPTEEVLALALASLARLLAVPLAALQAQLRASYVRNWAAEPYAYGAYSYPTVGAPAARAALATPVAGTLFFAGEGVYEGPAAGTVEAGLVSGQVAARAMLGQAAL
ncbi:flavin monoamine oxidase family protein [Hymenobacter cheonanensis]|uniref:flavin monoamine oxidase family protein n=1 Tax=Hymenobacter sp. CA2-7 TaxID=3063993 RepID=UPI0027138C2F|nr:NAD(P)/FAD-dependent oxidoreductase [Hymenobacter sp. CA2-7]MDO7884460.1 NAD(P)/FAD-dependent oxidoreductase [Hymenobacter sp. CA2-7]